MDKNKVFTEMMLHIPLNTQRYPKKVLIIGESCEYLEQEIKKYDIEVDFVDDSLNIDKKYDTIIDLIGIDKDKLSLIFRLLDEEVGIFVTKSENYSKDLDKLKNDINIIGKHFWITMPYKFHHQTAILASHKYHPQADIILDRSDFIDGYYYNSEVHNASFVMPNFIFKELTGVAKR